MGLTDSLSLSRTSDNVNDAFFSGGVIPDADRREAALWIAGRQGLPGAYARMFAPTEQDYREGAKVYTGEKVNSGGATGHVLGEEACRALALLGTDDPVVAQAFDSARAGIMERLGPDFDQHGKYCCGTCTSSFWRHISAQGFGKHEAWVTAGLATLKRSRLEGGKWRVFPFYYTVLALQGFDSPAVLEELRYAAPALEHSLKRRDSGDVYARRRGALAERVLARV